MMYIECSLRFIIMTYVMVLISIYHISAASYHTYDTEDNNAIQIPVLPSKLVEQVHEDNIQRFQKVEAEITDIMKRFEVEKYAPISAITHGISSGILDLGNARQDLRENLIYAQLMPQFKPAGIKDGKQRQLWDAIDDGVIQIYNAAFAVMTADAEFQGNFHRIYDSIQTAMNKIKNGLEFDLAIKNVKKDLKEWDKMQVKFELATDALSDDTFKTLGTIIRNAGGARQIQTQLQNAPKYYHDYTHEFDVYQELEDARFVEVQPIRTKLAEKTARKEFAQFEYNNYEKSAENKEWRYEKITEALDTLNDKYSKTDQNIKETKYRTEKRSSGWFGWSSKTVTVPYTVSIPNPERTRIRERIDIWNENKKENDKNLKTAQEKRSSWKEEAEKATNDIDVLQKQLTDIENKWKEKLDKQTEKLQLAEKKWKDTNDQLHKAFEETGINDVNIVEFLKLAHQFPEHAMRTHQSNKGMNEFIKVFYSFMEHRIKVDYTDETIKEHFDELGSKNYERIYNAMEMEGMNLMADLEITNITEYDEIVQVIDKQLEDANEKKMNFGEKRFLGRVIKGNFQNREIEKKTFEQEFELILDFFHDIYGGVRELKNQLPIVSKNTANEYYKIDMGEKKEL
eukprot:347063_1